MANDGALMQIEDGICPVKLLLLALRATRFFVTSDVVSGDCPVKELLRYSVPGEEGWGLRIASLVNDL